MATYLKDNKGDRDAQKRERQEVETFLKSAPVAALFEEY